MSASSSASNSASISAFTQTLPSVIEIRERERCNHGFRIAISLDRQPCGEIEAIAPDRAMSRQAYGAWLGAQIFQHPLLHAAYEGVRQNPETLRIEIVGDSPAFHAWDWEALGAEWTIVRRLSQKSQLFVQMPPSATLNVLLLSAHPELIPEQENPSNSLAIARSLVEPAQQSSGQLRVEMLRPATFHALRDRLRASSPGYFHMLHLECPTVWLTWEQYQEGMKRQRYATRRGGDLPELPAYSGSQPFLLFESQVDEKKNRAVPILVVELSELLVQRGVPLCTLHYTLHYTEGHVGLPMIAAGVPIVVNLGNPQYAGIERLIRAFYRELLAGKTIDGALREAKAAIAGEVRELILPAIYLGAPVALNLEFATTREVSSEMEERENWESVFRNRDREIRKIERMLLKFNVLHLYSSSRSSSGVGKTALLRGLTQWWQATHFAVGVFYFACDREAWTIERMLRAIALRIYDPVEANAFTVLNPVAQLQILVGKLKSEPYAIVLDGLEAVPQALTISEQQQLRDFLRKLVDGRTRVVLASQDSEEWLRDIFRSNIFGLPTDCQIIGNH